MARVKISDFVADPAGNVVGGTGYEINVYEAETTTLRTLYLLSSGVDTAPNPLTPNAGVDTTLTVQALPADTTLTVVSTSGMVAGQVVPLQSGANRTEVTIKTVTSATVLTLAAAVGGAFTYPVGAAVGGEEFTGHYQAWVENDLNTESVYKNTGTSKSAGRVFFPTKLSGIDPAIADAKGDLLAATGADAWDNEPAGANESILLTDSTTTRGIKWGARGAVTFVDDGSVSGAVTVDFTAAKFKEVLTGGNVTGFTLSNLTTGIPCYLMVKYGGAHTIAWTTTIKWTTGTTPTATSTLNKYDMFVFVKSNDGDIIGSADLNH